jgi:hypothetical protein
MFASYSVTKQTKTKSSCNNEFLMKNDVFLDLHCVAPVRTDVSEECCAAIIKVIRIGELGKLAVTSNIRPLRNIVFLVVYKKYYSTANVVPSSPIPVTLMMKAPHTSETSIFTKATQYNFPEDAILHCHCRGNLQSYIALTGWDL